MGYAIYQNDGRWAGYGVPAFCEHPGCDKEIDRGMSYACGGEPFNYGCSNYFCEKHLNYTGFKENGEMYPHYLCDHEDDCDCEFREVCTPCATNQPEYPKKPEHPEWVYHLLNHQSWAKWRLDHQEKVEELKKLPATMPEDWDNEPES